MKRFAMQFKAVWLCTFLLLGLPAMSYAGGSTCPLATGLIADGRILELDYVQPSGQPGNTVWYSFSSTAGHSYSVEVRDDLDGAPATQELAITFYSAACSTQMATGAPPYGSNLYRDTSAIEPQITPNTGIRISVPNPNTDTIAIKVTNSSTMGHYVSVSLSDTTLYGPLWSTGIIGSATYNSGFYFQNTTSQTINGTITLYKAPGLPPPATASSSITISGSYAQKFASELVTTNQYGNATFAHDGPPGSVLVDCVLTNSASGDYVMHKFEPVRQGSH